VVPDNPQDDLMRLRVKMMERAYMFGIAMGIRITKAIGD
jgi:hypothetical protein